MLRHQEASSSEQSSDPQITGGEPGARNGWGIGCADQWEGWNRKGKIILENVVLGEEYTFVIGQIGITSDISAT